ncbi:MAG: nucleotide exchange factor GrpE [Deltaproteobacteria bacterium]|nr:MAG: nucleotide exchange factor GrpE [Deltaproteobacteria bacterium]
MSQDKNQFALELPEDLLQELEQSAERQDRDRGDDSKTDDAKKADSPKKAEAKAAEPVEEEIPIDDSDDDNFIDVAAAIQEEMAAEDSTKPSSGALSAANEQLSEVNEQLKETESQLKKANRKVLELQTRLSQMEDNLRRTEQRRQDLDKERQQIHDKMLRLSADFDNLRKRTAREKQEMKKYGHEDAVRDIVAPLDNFERALESMKDAPDSVREGIQMVYKQLLDALARHGVQRFDSKGEPFDYTRHEAISVVESDELEPNTVLEEYQSGYMFHERLLRPSRVVVTKAPPKPVAPEPEVPAEEAADSLQSTAEHSTVSSESLDDTTEVANEQDAPVAGDSVAVEAAAEEKEPAPSPDSHEASLSSEEQQAVADLASDLEVEFSDEVPGANDAAASTSSEESPEKPI